jgi:hypothetical protein
VFTSLTPAEDKLVAREVERYSAFLRTPLRVRRTRGGPLSASSARDSAP